jgi:hypothetical protein
VLKKINVTTRKSFRFNLEVGRRAYKTRDIVRPAPVRQLEGMSCPATTKQESDNGGARTGRGNYPAARLKAQPKKQKPRQQEWLSRPAMARYLGFGKKKFQELLDAELIPHRSYPPKETLRFNIKDVEEALAKFDVKERS